MQKENIQLNTYIRAIADFPKAGILFRDITPLLADSSALEAAVELLAEPFLNDAIDYVAAVEARGFIFGSAVATALNAGFIPIRKPGKLPFATETVTYDLEYGTDAVEVHRDAVKPGSKVLMVDDLLATGGTMAAACKLMEKIGGQICGIAFLIELKDLSGRDKLKDYKIHSVLYF
jgi:adenine phosphoribosyltransferase